MRLAIISSAWSWPITRLARAVGQLQDGFDLVAHHAADRNAGPVADHRGHRLVVDGGQDQRRFALQRGQLVLHVLQLRAAALRARRRGRHRSGLRRRRLRRRRLRACCRCLPPGECRRAAWRAGRAVWSTSAFSAFQRASSAASRSRSLGQQLRWPRPRAGRCRCRWPFSRPMMPSSVSSASMRLRQSSTSAGVACWLTATRAQAVSSRLTALVGQLPRRDVAVADSLTAASSASSRICTLWCFSIVLSDAAHHQDGLGLVGLVDLHGLEAAGQRRVLLDVLLVLGPGGGADGAQRAARQRRLEQVGRIAGAGRTARADQRVRLVDEQDDRLRRWPAPRR